MILENTDKAVADLLNKIDTGVMSESATKAFEYLVQAEFIGSLFFVITGSIGVMICMIGFVMAIKSSNPETQGFGCALSSVFIVICLIIISSNVVSVFVPEAHVIQELLRRV